MNKISNICAITALLSVSGFASAEPTWHTSTINKVYPQSNGDVVLTFTQDHAKCTNGSIPKYYYLSANKNGVTAAGLQNIYSAALTAATANKEVTINFDSSTSDCNINRLLVVFR